MNRLPTLQKAIVDYNDYGPYLTLYVIIYSMDICGLQVETFL